MKQQTHVTANTSAWQNRKVFTNKEQMDSCMLHFRAVGAMHLKKYYGSMNPLTATSSWREHIREMSSAPQDSRASVSPLHACVSWTAIPPHRLLHLFRMHHWPWHQHAPAMVLFLLRVLPQQAGCEVAWVYPCRVWMLIETPRWWLRIGCIVLWSRMTQLLSVKKCNTTVDR